MTTLIAGGDSFTWGSELSDCNDEQYSRLSWSAIFANKRGYDYHCVAKPGSSNGSIARRIISAVESSDKDIYVAVMWTYTYRYEVKLRNGSWENLSAWQSMSHEERCKQMPPVNESHEQKMLKQYEYDLENGLVDLSKSFYNAVDYDFLKQDSINNIFLLQEYLNKNNINYVFAAACDDILLESKLIDKSKWLNYDIGFYEWCKSKNYKLKNNGHPPDEAHRDWINYYGDKI